MSLILQVLAFLFGLFLLVLLGRIVFEWIQMFARSWRPSGAALVVANIVYGITDPPLRFLRRWLKPVRVGDVSLDVAFLILFLVAWFGQSFLLIAAQAVR
ncbi:MAG TPA: YggT family protein [Actinomycetales bacterium]|nr:YggT family protein [Actinomycetales bacterium]